MSSNNAVNGIEHLTEAWADFQRQAWDAWTDCVGMKQFDPPWEPLRKRSARLIEELTKTCLRAQIDGAKLVMNWANGNGGDNLREQFTHNMREMVDSRTELQQQIYESWFKAMRETSPFPSEHLQKNGNGLTQSWKRVMEETLQAQAEFISALMLKKTESEIPQSVPSRKEKGAARALA